MKTVARILLLTFTFTTIASPVPGAAAVQGSQYIVVLKKATEEPDLAKYGGQKQNQWMDRLVVRVPDQSLEQLKADPRVLYVQRLLAPGETPPDSPATFGPVAMNATVGEPSAEASTDPNWSSGTYKYDGAGNVINIGANYYVYDQLSRLRHATLPGTTAHDIYRYDSFGNLYERETTLGGGTSWTYIPVSGSSNRLTNAQYDGVGNLLSGGGTPHFFKWDPFRMMIEQSGSFGYQQYYVYTADDQRIGTFNNGQGVWKWTPRDLGGLVVREYESGNYPGAAWMWVEDFVHRDAFVAASVREAAEGGRRHYHLDHLGTPRLVTNAAGQAVSRHDYTPYGLEITSIRQEQARGYRREAPLRFTGHERDFNGGTWSENTDYTDYMHARYYRPGQARFLTVDAGEPDVRKPRTWNRYSYAHNNPLRYIDPDGNIPVETAIDVISFSASFYSMVTAPSWANAGYLLWDAASIFIPYAPGSWVAKVGKIGHAGLKAAGIIKPLTKAETVINNALIKEGVGLLGQGDDSVRQVLGMKSTEKAADFLGVTKNGTFKIVEGKGTDMDSAVTQLTNTANALQEKVGDKVKFTAEVAISAGTNLNNLGIYKVVGNHLLKLDTLTGKYKPVVVNRVHVTVRIVGGKG